MTECGLKYRMIWKWSWNRLSIPALKMRWNIVSMNRRTVIDRIWLENTEGV